MVLLGAGMLLVTAMPAQAKEGEGAEVDGVTVAVVGPGLQGPIVLGRDDAVAFDDQLQTFQEMAKMTVRPTVALGPRYQVLMTVRCLDNGYTTASIHEDLYPYATSGPWAFTGAGQSTCLGSVPAGWISAQSGTFAFLMAHGLPSTPPPAIAGPLRPAPASHGPSFRPWVLLAAALGLGALALVAALAFRPRKARVVA